QGQAALAAAPDVALSGRRRPPRSRWPDHRRESARRIRARRLSLPPAAPDHVQWRPLERVAHLGVRHPRAGSRLRRNDVAGPTGAAPVRSLSGGARRALPGAARVRTHRARLSEDAGGAESALLGRAVLHLPPPPGALLVRARGGLSAEGDPAL